MNGLSGYFNNRLQDLGGKAAVVEAMRIHTQMLVVLLSEAAQLFARNTDVDAVTTWRDVLRRYDPTSRPNDVQHRFEALSNCGLSGASIAEPSGEREPPMTWF